MTPRLLAALLLVVVPSVGLAADRSTCKALGQLLKGTDRALASVASGQALRTPSSGMATWARGAKDMAEKFSTKVPLPDHVVDALSAMESTSTRHPMLVAAAPDLRKHGLVVQAELPRIRPKSEVPDLARHATSK